MSVPCVLKILIHLQFWTQTCDEAQTTCSLPKATSSVIEKSVELLVPKQPQEIHSARFEWSGNSKTLKAQIFRVFEAPPKKRRYLQFQYDLGSTFCSTAVAEPESKDGDLAPLICAWTDDSAGSKRRFGVTAQHSYRCVSEPSSDL